MMMHTTADDPKRYRTEEEVDSWKKRDPITRFQKYLMEKGFLSQDKVDTLNKDIEEEIQAAVDHAEEQMKKFTDPLVMFDHVYAEMPPHLVKQKEELVRELAAMQEEEAHG
jgi:pyruvate dehydrogenase E1 component alpha subunit